METSRHKLREVGMTCLYQTLLTKIDIREVVFNNSESNEIDPFLYTITIDAYNNKDKYIELINKHINKEWTYDRLGYVEKAILLLACCELDSNTCDRAIVIDEAINLTKKFCDEETYKLINGLLDKIYR